MRIVLLFIKLVVVACFVFFLLFSAYIFGGNIWHFVLRNFVFFLSSDK